MGELNETQRYFIEEHVEDYRDGHITRRELVRRVTLIAGGAVTLSWTTQNAVRVTITGLGLPADQPPLSGSLVVKPVTNTSYTLIAYGANGQAVTAVLYIFVR